MVLHLKRLLLKRSRQSGQNVPFPKTLDIWHIMYQRLMNFTKKKKTLHTLYQVKVIIFLLSIDWLDLCNSTFCIYEISIVFCCVYFIYITQFYWKTTYDLLNRLFKLCFLSLLLIISVGRENQNFFLQTDLGRSISPLSHLVWLCLRYYGFWNITKRNFSSPRLLVSLCEYYHRLTILLNRAARENVPLSIMSQSPTDIHDRSTVSSSNNNKSITLKNV